MWTTATTGQFALSDDQIDFLASILDLQTWPPVLMIGPRHDSITERDRFRSVAESELRAAGWLVDDCDPAAGVLVDDALAEVLSVLAGPDMSIEIRCHGATSTQRAALVRRGDRHVLATRDGVGLQIRDVAIADEHDVGRVVAQLLEPADAAQAPSVSVPADELRRRLDGATSAGDYADALHAMGVTAGDAATYSVLFADCEGHSEIVAIECAPGRTRRSAGAVAVYDTARGRIVAGPSMSPDGQVWATLSPGTGHRISQAVTLLMETLPGGRWLP